MDLAELWPELCSLPLGRPSARPWRQEPTEHTTHGFINQLLNFVRSTIADSSVWNPFTTLQESSAKLPCRHERLEDNFVNLHLPAPCGVESSAKLLCCHELLGGNLVNLQLPAPRFIPPKWVQHVRVEKSLQSSLLPPLSASNPS